MILFYAVSGRDKQKGKDMKGKTLSFFSSPMPRYLQPDGYAVFCKPTAQRAVTSNMALILPN